jgi:hypothetical protein
MTPSGTASPPITTPAPNSPMPALPKQPASINGCIEGPTISTGDEPKGDSAEESKEEIQEPFPAGISEE